MNLERESNLKFLIFISLFFLTTNLQAQKQLGQTVTHNDSINSQYLKGGTLNYYIHLPSNYDNSTKSYPVLYVLDGQMHFTSAVAIQHSLGNETDVPEMIIVGLENSYPKRRDLVWKTKEKFVSFLSNELIPLIDKKYRTKKERIVFGWEMGSNFASYLLLHKNQLFDGAISANGGHIDESTIKSFRDNGFEKVRYLYLANSIKDIFSIDITKNSVEALNNQPSQYLKWKSDSFNNETHSSVPYLAMFHGLRYFYHNYNSYDFYSIKQYEEFGGIPAIQQYFKERSNRFGFSEEIDNPTKNTLIWLAWKRDQFKYFDNFMTEFEDVLKTKRYQSEYWQNRLGQYYLKNKKYDRAIHFFNIAKVEFEATARIYHGLGQAYLGKSNKKMAIENFQLAVAKAKLSSDKKLDKYQSDLNDVKKDAL